MLARIRYALPPYRFRIVLDSTITIELVTEDSAYTRTLVSDTRSTLLSSLARLLVLGESNCN